MIRPSSTPTSARRCPICSVAWGLAKQIAAELADRGVDLTDPETVRQEVRALNAERLARALLDQPDDADA